MDSNMHLIVNCSDNLIYYFNNGAYYESFSESCLGLHKIVKRV